MSTYTSPNQTPSEIDSVLVESDDETVTNNDLEDLTNLPNEDFFYHGLPLPSFTPLPHLAFKPGLASQPPLALQPALATQPPLASQSSLAFEPHLGSNNSTRVTESFSACPFNSTSKYIKTKKIIINKKLVGGSFKILEENILEILGQFNREITQDVEDLQENIGYLNKSMEGMTGEVLKAIKCMQKETQEFKKEIKGMKKVKNNSKEARKARKLAKRAFQRD